MLRIFLPNMYVSKCKYIPLMELKDKGIDTLLVDVDNTLIPLETNEPSDDVYCFMDKCKVVGIEVILVSNNVKSRVSYLANKCGWKYYSFALKPFPFIFMHIMKKHELRHDKIAIVGDQLFTDVLGGNSLNIFTILCKPIKLEDKTNSTWILRKLENRVFKYFEKTNKMNRGKFDDDTM